MAFLQKKSVDGRPVRYTTGAFPRVQADAVVDSEDDASVEVVPEDESFDNTSETAAIEEAFEASFPDDLLDLSPGDGEAPLFDDTPDLVPEELLEEAFDEDAETTAAARSVFAGLIGAGWKRKRAVKALADPSKPKSAKGGQGAHSASAVTDHVPQHSALSPASRLDGPRARKICLGLLIAKYVFSAVLIVMAASAMREPWFAVIGLIELAAVFFLTNLIANRHKVLASVANDVLIFIINAQFVVLYFGSSFVTLVMLTNINAAADLEGNAAAYITGLVAAIAFTFLPILYHVRMPRLKNIKLSWLTNALCAVVALALALGLSCATAGKYDPYVGLCDLVKGAVTKGAVADKYADTAADEFYREDVPGNRDKPVELPEHPNVIIIFTEGLSQSVVDDDYDVMPNVRYWETQSLNFTNYFNHTFATYRGIIGQLYSGYQRSNYDANSLISIQGILSDNGYTTRFINTEPGKEDFTEYLGRLGFDAVISPETSEVGNSHWITDGQAYDYLFETAEELNAEGQPFFIGIYTFNTHVSLQSKEEVYGDGSNDLLNKFYNCDYQFGQFMERFNESDLADNTIIIFTGDHCTYRDKDFSAVFPTTAEEREYGMLDEMPFFIYYKGIAPETVDAAGRNSLDMAPTVLDYLDITGPNYFLGSSLFLPAEESAFVEHVFLEEERYFITETGVVREPTDDEADIAEEIVGKYLNVCNPAISSAAANAGWRPDEVSDPLVPGKDND